MTLDDVIETIHDCGIGMNFEGNEEVNKGIEIACKWVIDLLETNRPDIEAAIRKDHVRTLNDVE